MNKPYTMESEFWSWFSINEHRFFDESSKEYEKLLDELLDILHAYCRELNYEINYTDDNIAELIISAYGDKNYFNKVISLTSIAPKLERWRITAFKPPMEREFVLDIDGIDVDTSEIYFEPLSNSRRPGQIGLSIYVKDCERIDKNTMFGAMHVILMTIVGEKSVAEDIHYVRINNLMNVEEKFMPLSCLPEYIEWFKTKFN